MIMTERIAIAYGMWPLQAIYEFEVRCDLCTRIIWNNEKIVSDASILFGKTFTWTCCGATKSEAITIEVER